jgi:hypothetical protein
VFSWRTGLFVLSICLLTSNHLRAQDLGGCNAILEPATGESYNAANAASTYNYDRNTFCSVYQRSKSRGTAASAEGAYKAIFGGSAAYSSANAETVPARLQEYF